MQARTMSRIFGKKLYNSETARLIASDSYWDGRSWDREGRNTFLFRTPNGHYFAQCQTKVRGEVNSIKPLELDEAIALYGSLQKKEVRFMFAFPGVEVADA